MRIIKATPEEKAEYQNGNPVNPLFGFIIFDGHRLAVEYLGEGPGEPNYEVMAPSGKMFDGGTHTLLGTTQADLFDSLVGESIVADKEVA